MPYRYYATLIVLALYFSSISSVADAKSLNIVTTIKPIHSLVTAVVGEAARPQLLLERKDSPHHFSLKPSVVRDLKQADVIFYVGNNLETFIPNAARLLSDSTKLVALIDAEGVTLLATRENEAWHEEADKFDKHHDHQHEGGNDPHIWLSPDNAIVMVQHIAKVLSELDVQNAELYQRNANTTIGRIKGLDKQLENMLVHYKDNPFIVLHDAYQYFSVHYNLNAVAAITVSPEHKPGAKRIAYIRNEIINHNVACVFTEPQMASSSLSFLVEKDDITIAELDPLGVDVEKGSDAYFSIMQNLANNFTRCFLERKVTE